jgi:protein-histidine pros-kinase
LRRRLDSLKVRLLLIVLAGIAALQLLSYGAVGMSRGFEARHLSNAQTASDVLWLHGALLATPPAERAARLPGLRRGTYRPELWPADRALPAPPGGDLQALRAAVAQQAAGPDAKAGSAGLTVQATSAGGLPALVLPLDAGQRLAVVFDAPLPSTRPSWWQVLLYAGAITALVAGLSIRAVAVVTRPLEQLTAAGRRMAGDIAHATPLAERGPAEVRSLAADFNTMQQAIQRQLRERTFILAAISHDLKTPLTRLKLRLADLPAGLRTPVAADLDAMGALVDEGLDYARSAQLRETRMPVDLGALVESVADQSADMGHDVSFTPPDAAITVPGAPRALGRLLQNLVDNAVQYGGSAQLSLHPGEAEVEIRIADRGPGLAPDQRERMFEPFVRGESSRNRRSGGTGLGLAIARNIALAHGGRVWLGAREGGGLVAHVALPLAHRGRHADGRA